MIKKQQQKIKLLAFLVLKQTFLFWKRASQNKTRQSKKNPIVNLTVTGIILKVSPIKSELRFG